MFELMVSIPATLLCFKDLKSVFNSSVVKSESLRASLKGIKYSVKIVETGEIFFARVGPTFVKKELISFAICSAKCSDFFLIFSALAKVLFLWFILPVVSLIICHDLLLFPWRLAGLSAFWETWKTCNYHGIQISIMEKMENLEIYWDFVKKWPGFFSNAVLGFYLMTIFKTV